MAVPFQVVFLADHPRPTRWQGSGGGPPPQDLRTAGQPPTDKTPEQWARATVEGVHPWARFVAWRVLCGLRLEPRPSPDYLAGWRIADRGDGWIRMEASSWFMTAQIVFHVDEGHVSFATFVRYDKPMAALVWPAVSIIHRRAVPELLRYAV